MEKAQNAGFLIKQISEQTDKRINNDLKQHNLTSSQFRAMVILSHASSNITQKNLEEILKVSHATTSGIVAGLNEKGLVKCAFDGDDKREKYIYITDAGLGLLNRIRDGAEKTERLLFKGVEDYEIDNLVKTLKKIGDNLQSE